MMLGRTVGHYRITDRLGGGGMGVVYRAEDVKLRRTVALKFLPPELTRDPEAKHRFEREAKAASQLDHPNICTVYGFGESDDEQMYLAMACYDGESLADKVARGPVPLDEAIGIVEQIARGLGKAHAAGIVHRDIKPANVMVTSDGVVKILDFGLAKITLASKLTKSHTTVGTPAYMAPEQLRGEDVGPQADIWSLGIVLFELLTGDLPFRGEYQEALSYSILNEQPATLPDQPEVDRIIKRMLRKDPLQRYQSVDEVLADLLARRAPVEQQELRGGAKLGSYEIVKSIGGKVYLARDARLDRQVAIRIVPERPKRQQLTHPNVCTLFEVGEQEGVHYVAMEFLDGETLGGKKLPLPQVLKIGVQIAEGLAAAHKEGIVHGDLKPSNVMITKSGAVKLLDFGLSKDGLSPEQIEGKEADARTDIFAFGAILYELAAGRRAFEGETKASLAAAILERDPPPLSAIPAALDHIIRRCLAKDAEERWQSARDVGRELAWIAGDGLAKVDPAPATRRRRLRAAVPWIAAAILAIIMAVLALRPRPVNRDTVYHRYEIPAAGRLYTDSSLFTVSPEGKHFVANALGDNGVRRLFIRDPSDPEIKPIAGTENVEGHPHFSPDAQTVYFTDAGGNLKGLPLSGGMPANLGKIAASGYWFTVNSDGLVLYDDQKTIYSFLPLGGKASAVTKLDPASGEISHTWPWFLPDGKRFLFLAQSRSRSGEETGTIYLAALGSETKKPLVHATSRVSYAPPGYLLFARGHTLMAVPFDLQREAVTGAEVPLLDDLHIVSAIAWAGFSASNDGVLTYRPRVDRFRFEWLDAGGKELPGLKRFGIFYSFSVSPDGKRLAVSLYDEITGKANIWAYGLDRETSSKVTFGPLDEHFPVWIDEHRIAYGVGERYEFGGQQAEIRLTSVDEPGPPTMLVGGGGLRWPTGIAATGVMLLYTEVREGRREIWQVAVDGGRKPEALVRAPFNVDHGSVSPNGKWLIYTSDESGREETYVRPYGRSGARLQVSTNGASGIWSRDGKKIFLRHRDEVLSLAVAETGDRLELGEPQLLFSARDMWNFAEGADGRFLVQLPLDSRQPPTIVITNWLALMNERLRK